MFTVKVSSWVFSEIVSQEDPKLRVKTIVHFTTIIQHLQSLNNFNGMMEIVAGLGNSSVNRMKKSWHV